MCNVCEKTSNFRSVVSSIRKFGLAPGAVLGAQIYIVYYVNIGFTGTVVLI